MRILIVDDDIELCKILQRLLESDGYCVTSVTSAQSALDSIALEEPNLVLLDVALDSEDGRDLFLEIQLICDAPVVFMTGRASEMDRISGLKMGADDYIVKPFSPGELTARVAAILRRSFRAAPPEADREILVFGALRIDSSSHEVYLCEQAVALTAKEFDLLAFFGKSPRRVFSRGQLLEHVWDSSADWQDEATVTEHIRRLRRKIETDPDHPKWISTVRGVGYRFDPN